MMQIEKAPFAPKIKKILDRIGSRKRSCLVLESECRPQSLRSYWDGGSRTEFVCFDVNGNRKSIPVGGSAFDATVEEYVPVPGDVLVRAGTSCGKPATPFITFFTVDKVTL